MPQFKDSQIRTSVSMLIFFPFPILAIIFVVRPAAIASPLFSYCAQPAYARGVYSLCAFILLPFSRFRGSCSYYIKVLAIPQTFLDTTAGSKNEILNSASPRSSSFYSCTVDIYSFIHPGMVISPSDSSRRRLIMSKYIPGNQKHLTLEKPISISKTN